MAPQIRFPPQDFETIIKILAEALKLPEAAEHDPAEVGEEKGGGLVVSTPAPIPGVSPSFAKEFNATTRHVLGIGGNNGNGGARSLSIGKARIQPARADLQALAASGRGVGWFLKLASTAVALLGAEDSGLTRTAWRKAGEMLAPDPHGQALQSLSVTQV